MPSHLEKTLFIGSILSVYLHRIRSIFRSSNSQFEIIVHRLITYLTIFHQGESDHLCVKKVSCEVLSVLFVVSEPPLKAA